MSLITLFSNTSNPVDMEVFSPPTTVAARGVSVVVAYGTDGLSATSKPLIENFCKELANGGYTVAVPRFLERTNTSPGVGSVTADLTSPHLASWTSALVEAVGWCSANQGNKKVGLIGFSLGGYMAARAAIATPVNCFIDFFGPMQTFGLTPWPTSEAFDATKAASLPPTQIHHGNQDIVVRPSESASLQAWLVAAHIACDLYTDYDCGHPQQPEGIPWTAVEQAKATPRALKFLATI